MTDWGPGSGRPRGSSAWRVFRPRTPHDRPWIIAHRGDCFRAPENTLEAARRAFETGAQAWELDVRLSRDGVPVVIHDASLSRTTDVARRFAADPRARSGFLVADFDLDEIQALDAGSWFVDPAGGPRTARAFGTLAQLTPAERALFGSGRVRVPTLAQALALTGSLGWRVNIELKATSADDPSLLDRVLAAIDDAGAAAWVAVSSFDHADIAAVARRRDLATGVLTATPLYQPARYVRALIEADAYHPSAAAVGADSARYRRSPSAATLRQADFETLRAEGVPIFVYTINEPSLARHLAEAGVAGLFTDDPITMMTALGEGG
jgi:glycerophosphoryl diester phosphodiesterase